MTDWGVAVGSVEINRVLVVDDDPDIRNLLMLNLELSGFEVEVACDGIEAERMALDACPDLIVLDVMMPFVDGLSVLAHLRADDRTRDIPVVVLTAKANDEDVWAGWEAGADYYMTKPFDFDQLERFIRYLEQPGTEPLPA